MQHVHGGLFHHQSFRKFKWIRITKGIIQNMHSLMFLCIEPKSCIWSFSRVSLSDHGRIGARLDHCVIIKENKIFQFMVKYKNNYNYINRWVYKAIIITISSRQLRSHKIIPFNSFKRIYYRLLIVIATCSYLISLLWKLWRERKLIWINALYLLVRILIRKMKHLQQNNCLFYVHFSIQNYFREIILRIEFKNWNLL